MKMFCIVYVIQVGSGNGSKSTRRSMCYNATNLSTRSISANSLLAAAPRTAMLRSWWTRTITPPSTKQPHMTVDYPIFTDRTAIREHRCKGNYPWTGKDSFACIISMFTIWTSFFKCRNQRLVMKCLQVSGSIWTRRVIFITFHL